MNKDLDKELEALLSFEKGLKELQSNMAYASTKTKKRPSRVLTSAIFLVLLAGIIFLNGWIFMLTVGALYLEFNLLAPVGFWPSVGIAAGLFYLLKIFFGRNDKKK